MMYCVHKYNETYQPVYQTIVSTMVLCKNKNYNIHIINKCSFNIFQIILYMLHFSGCYLIYGG